jgi:two-component sensor histidine kinase
MAQTIPGRILFVCVMFCCSVCCSLGQGLYYRTISVEDGLLSSDNYRTYQDRAGYIWICSRNGINKYDGKNIRTFTVADGLPVNDIWDLSIDSRNRIWLHSYMKGLYYIYQDKVCKVPGTAQIDNLFFSGEKGDTVFFSAYHLDLVIGGGRYYLTPDGKFKENLRHADQNAYIWADFGSGQQLLRQRSAAKPYRSERWKETASGPVFLGWNLFPLDGLLKEAYTQVFIWQKGEMDTLVLRTDKGFTLVESQQHFGGTLTELSPIFPNRGFVAIVNDSLRVYHNIYTKQRDQELETRLRQFWKGGKLPWFCMLDKEQNLWLTEKRGRILFVPFFVSNNTIYQEKNGTALAGFTQGQRDFVCWNTQNAAFCFGEKRVLLPNDPNKVIRQVIYWHGNPVLLHPHAVALFDQKTGQILTIPFPKQFSYTNLTIYQDSDSTFIDGSGSQYLFDGKSIRWLGRIYPITGKRVRNICIAGNLLVWSGEAGAFFYNIREKRLIRHIAVPEVNFIKISDGRVFCGTNGSGMQVYDLQGKLLVSKFARYSVNGLVFYGEHLLLGTNKGVLVCKLVRRKQLWQLDMLETINFFDGLSGSEIIGIGRLREHLIVATIHGIDMYPLEKINRGNFPKPALILKSIRVNNQPYRGQDYRFSWDQSSLQISFRTLAFHCLGDIRYAYTLKGKEVHTDYVSRENAISLSGLTPGDYVLTVRAISCKGVKSDPQVLHFTILPHFGDTVWFRSLVILLIFGLIGFGFYGYYQRKLKSEGLQRKFADLQLKSLRAQLNPHFIFNSLNSIQSLLLLKGEKHANSFIHAFAGLMRNTLDNSRHEKILLKDEIEFLKSYLSLESLRMDGKIQYEITVGEGVRPEKVSLLNMTLQPIVENSIIHGLLPKESGERHIDIGFSVTESFLVCRVRDNGIGRKRSMELKAAGKQQYRSWSSTILLERIEVLRAMREMAVDYEIVDLYDNNGESAGTEVIIKLEWIDEDESTFGRR